MSGAGDVSKVWDVVKEVESWVGWWKLLIGKVIHVGKTFLDLNSVLEYTAWNVIFIIL